MLWLFTACIAEPSSEITGQIFDSQGAGVPNANIEVRDENAFVYSETQADSEGFFKADLPPLSTFFLVLSAENMPPTSFTGFSGEGETSVEDGTLWLRTLEEVNEVQSAFTVCEQSGFPMIDGEVRVGIPAQEAESLPLITTATALAINVNGVVRNGCYVPDEDGEAEATGPAGKYGIFDLQTGIHTLRISVKFDQDTTLDYDHLMYVPAEGSAPLYPTLIPL